MADASKLAGVLLDVDGTLVDSNRAHAAAWLDAFERHHKQVSPAEVRRAIGMGGDKIVRALAGVSPESSEGQAILSTRSRIFQVKYLPTVRPFPRARQLVQRIRREGLMVAVASSAERAEVRGLLEMAGVADLIERTASADDAEASKPEPDIVAAALEQLELPPSAAMMLGDTPYDCEAAARAGVRMIGVLSGGWAAGDLHPVVAVYRDVAELFAEFDCSPLTARARMAAAEARPA